MYSELPNNCAANLIIFCLKVPPTCSWSKKSWDIDEISFDFQHIGAKTLMNSHFFSTLGLKTQSYETFTILLDIFKTLKNCC